MTRALMVRSIPLSSVTRDAWKQAGAMFARRTRTPNEIEAIGNGRPIINLGNSSMNIDGAWNNAPVVAPLLSPAASRTRLSDLMPTDKWVGEGIYWLKGQGRGGANKEKLYVTTEASHNEVIDRARWMQGDVQQNIVGTEYRVITVGVKVVQVMKRSGLNGQRVYEWIGVGACPPGVKYVAREAAGKLDNERTIIGWDIVVDNFDDRVFILEGNSCPGVNEATARRILDAVEGTSYDG